MNHLLFIGVGQIVIIALVVLLLFGGTKIPELMKGLGKGYKIFKDEVDKQLSLAGEPPVRREGLPWASAVAREKALGSGISAFRACSNQVWNCSKGFSARSFL